MKLAPFEIEERDAHARLSGRAVPDRLREPCGRAMGGDVEDGQRPVGSGGRARPREPAILAQIGARIGAQHGAVRGGDDGEVERLDQVERLGDEAAEGPHQPVEIMVHGEAEIAHPVVEEPLVAIVAAEEIAGEEDPLLDEIGALRVGPVDVGRGQEAQPPAAQIRFGAGGDGQDPGRLEGIAEEGAQDRQAAGREADLGLRRPAQQLGQGAGMVGLEVVEHDLRDLVVAGHGFEAREEGLGMIRMHRVDHRHARRAADGVGVVARAVGRLHQRVEAAQPPGRRHRSSARRARSRPALLREGAARRQGVRRRRSRDAPSAGIWSGRSRRHAKCGGAGPATVRARPGLTGKRVSFRQRQSPGGREGPWSLASPDLDGQQGPGPQGNSRKGHPSRAVCPKRAEPRQSCRERDITPPCDGAARGTGPFL